MMDPIQPGHGRHRSGGRRRPDRPDRPGEVHNHRVDVKPGITCDPKKTGRNQRSALRNVDVMQAFQLASGLQFAPTPAFDQSDLTTYLPAFTRVLHPPFFAPARNPSPPIAPRARVAQPAPVPLILTPTARSPSPVFIPVTLVTQAVRLATPDPIFFFPPRPTARASLPAPTPVPVPAVPKAYPPDQLHPNTQSKHVVIDLTSDED